MERVDSAVIGAGVVGIAVARALALAGREVVLIERERQFGTDISSRNSEVIHAGISYPSGSLKARFCVEGRRKLYDFARARGVAVRRCGKLIVATDPAQDVELDALAATAVANGVDDLSLLTSAEATRLEPELTCTAALLSPSTGIVDSHAFMLALLAEAEANGAVVAFRSEVGRVEPRGDGFAVTLAGETDPTLLAATIVNAAGLHAPELAHSIVGLAPEHVPQPHWAKGSYFSLAGRSPFQRLIYPIPERGGLGIHATIDLAGRVRFGPDVEWCERIDYRVDRSRAELFYASIRRYWPALRDGALAPDYCGVRPKICGPGEPAADFVISGPERHGLPGLVNLFGIESPGLTSAMAIADCVASRLG